MEHLIRLIDIIAWPATLMLIVWLLRKQIKLLAPLIQRIRYKDFEIEFSKRLEQLKEDVEDSSLPEAEVAETSAHIFSLVEISPSLAVIEAWKEIEHSAQEKVRQLVPEGETYKDPERRPIDYLDYKGALVPSTASAIRELRMLRNEAVHASADISKENAIQYAAVADRIRLYIDGITELPAVKLSALTLLVLELNHLVDSQKYNDITIDEVYRWIDDKNILSSLKKRTAGDSDFSLFEEGPYSNFPDFYHDQMDKLAGGYAGDHRRKWGVENLGLCLLLAWTNELIQLGSGWYPSEM